MSQILYQRMDLILISLFLPLNNVGIYNPIFKICIVLVLCQRAINFYFVPKISTSIKNKEKFQSDVTQNVIINSMFIVVTGALIIVFKNNILLMFGEDFLIAGIALVIIVVGEIFSCFFGGGITMFLLMMSGHHKRAMGIIFYTLLLNLLLNIILIPHFGIEGAAIATATSTVLKSTLFFFITKKVLKVSTFTLHMPLFLKKIS